MNGTKILIDANIAINLFKGDSRLANLLQDREAKLSFIVELELTGYQHITVPDAIIAATSVFVGVPLLSIDDHFERVKELIFIFYEP